MATLKITYYSGTDPITHMAYDRMVDSEVIAIAAGNTLGAAIKDGSALARVRAVGAACRFAKGSATSDASSGVTQYLADGEVMDVHVKAGNKFGVIADAT